MSFGVEIGKREGERGLDSGSLNVLSHKLLKF